MHKAESMAIHVEMHPVSAVCSGHVACSKPTTAWPNCRWSVEPQQWLQFSLLDKQSAPEFLIPGACVSGIGTTVQVCMPQCATHGTARLPDALYGLLWLYCPSLPVHDAPADNVSGLETPLIASNSLCWCCKIVASTSHSSSAEAISMRPKVTQSLSQCNGVPGQCPCASWLV